MRERTPGPADRDLVAAHLGGDPAALAGIYDRYADALFDTAAAMLSDRAEAEDLTHDVFLVAARRLDQLRDPDRLRPWLFAILRNEVYRRSKRRSRVRPTDFSHVAVDMAAPPDPHGEAADVERSELAAFVREAAGGLAERDQLILELSARQGLSGADLADALGVSLQQSHVLLHRMRARVERSLTALAVARNGRRDCEELQAVLRTWDGTFDTRVRKRVAAHVDGCETCQRTSRKVAAVPLLPAAPAFAAPPGLRDRVLQSSAGGDPGAGGQVRFGADGFPSGIGGGRWLGLVAAVVTLALVVGGGGWLLATGGPDAGPESVVVLAGTSTTSLPATSTATTTTATSTAPTTSITSTTSTAPAMSTTTSSSTSTTAPTTSAPTTSAPTTSTGPPPASTSPPPPSPAPPPPPPEPGTLVLSSTALDLGSAGSSAPLTLRNVGDEPLDWAITGDATPFTLSAGAGTLAAGQAVDLEVAIDRGPLPEGPVVRDLTVGSSAIGTSPLTVRATVERAPVVSVVDAPSFLRCPRPAGSVVVRVADESAIERVVLRWTGPGVDGSTPMSPGRDSWTGRLTPAEVSGDWTWTVEATDVRGNRGEAGSPFVVSGC